MMVFGWSAGQAFSISGCLVVFVWCLWLHRRLTRRARAAQAAREALRAQQRAAREPRRMRIVAGDSGRPGAVERGELERLRSRIWELEQEIAVRLPPDPILRGLAVRPMTAHAIGAMYGLDSKETESRLAHLIHITEQVSRVRRPNGDTVYALRSARASTENQISGANW